MNKTLLVASVVTFLGGCASSGRIGDLPHVAQGEASSQLVVMRSSSLVGVANSYYVALDGKDVFSIRSGEYTKFPIPPGEHFVSVKCFGGWSPTWKEDSEPFVASANQPNYFKVSPSLTCAKIEQISPDAAKEAISKSTFVSPGTLSSKQE